MNLHEWLPLLILGSSLLTGICIFFLAEEQRGLRTFLNLAGAFIKLALVVYMVVGMARGETYETRFPIVLGFDFVLKADSLSLLLVGLSSGLWLLTTVYAIGYLEHWKNRSRFFGFFSFCVTASVGVALAGNPITFFIFYEFLTLSTYPLVIHRGSVEALRAGRTYLWYTMAGGALVFTGVVWLHVLVGSVDFREAGVLAVVDPSLYPSLTLIFALLICGLGVKAALVPLHGWLPVAMVAPAPVSALLHAVAVVKAGAFGIVRVVYDLFGVQFADQLGLLTPLTIAASITILYGSLRALTQDDLKKRLAYSTVSQVSYIALGVSMIGATATIGGLVHLVHQGIMKITLFFCAGIFAETVHVKAISNMNGIGRRFPLTMGAFTIGALGMIGVPPVAGFISKWYLGLGAMASGQPWVLLVLLGSTALNAGYFLPVLYRAWFRDPDGPWHEEGPVGRLEAPWMLLVPCLITGLLSLLTGVFAGADWSPLSLARIIAMKEYLP
ncbi:MAG: monovalent cation/H+ antiporter subunit D family protein [Verrucomicrobia bacterium]|nr:monovalent cation/H+ antiporter subunit D family protein [Kiritimatiellia bacterium]MCP5487592.1 monovalent cation/H+ antiporter subunit D family protein [Verrucomicrobiota bacterium]